VAAALAATALADGDADGNGSNDSGGNHTTVAAPTRRHVCAGSTG